MHKQIRAALKILSEPEISSAKLAQLRELLNNVDPQVDMLLQVCERELGTLEKVIQGDVISLAADTMPETTDEERNRKKAVVIFLKYWNQLKGEVERVRAELHSTEPSLASRLFGGAKGPLAIVTLVAIAVVAAFYTTSVTVAITNNGCSERIPATLTLPPVTVGVDARIAGELRVSVFGNVASIAAPDQLIFDEQDLLGKKTDIDLGSAPLHTLLVACN